MPEFLYPVTCNLLEKPNWQACHPSKFNQSLKRYRTFHTRTIIFKKLKYIAMSLELSHIVSAMR
ncbi:hypothetical protein CV_0959 [Chromobacterium violaceum ATCC 12472]|uniref:Uncharacterized protein n=1 Tax=Chromobacterium violaceum (strain ATCC 12472 / DSM 30191 / JCM 1249 / CCUG 213 / NBRC 12614 / NCIMB 9131 / NCTC 9757 / MK) TaxID=243365 RepID=Q7NZG3_CHRVO|nr:hypothetical protein CV_0959 [Chromobacterium violaceum ATCC 12472]